VEEFCENDQSSVEESLNLDPEVNYFLFYLLIPYVWLPTCIQVKTDENIKVVNESEPDSSAVEVRNFQICTSKLQGTEIFSYFSYNLGSRKSFS